MLNEKPEKYTKRFFWVSHTHLIFDGALVVEEGGEDDDVFVVVDISVLVNATAVVDADVFVDGAGVAGIFGAGVVSDDVFSSDELI